MRPAFPFAAALLLIASCSHPNELLLEAEAFSDPGGWVTDQQAVDVLGSPYLLAHGYGRPVQDAVTTVDLEAGTYHVYVRTYNWTAPWHEGEGPGRFALVADGDTLSSSLGVSGRRWEWQEASSFKHERGPCEVRLVDLGGKVRSAQGSAYSLPTSLKLAADYTFAWEQVSLQGALDADYYFSGHYCVAAGVNLGLGGIGFLRGGYRYASPQAVLPSGLGLGGGVQFKGVTLDLAVMTASPTLSGTWMAGIGYRF